MEFELSTLNAKTLDLELNWFERVLEQRLKAYFEGDQNDIKFIEPPDISQDPSNYATLIKAHTVSKNGIAERITLILSVIPHIRPQALDPLLTKNPILDQGFTEFGGIKNASYGGFLPTGETVMFVLAGGNLRDRFSFMQLFGNDHPLFAKGIVRLHTDLEHEPQFQGALTLNLMHLHQITTGNEYKPAFSQSFPAHLLETSLEWDDLVLPASVISEIELIQAWIKNSKTLSQNLQLTKILPSGYKCLFHGPSGTGKTLTASLIGKTTGLAVYRVDLSMLVSKYIGETEKNLATLFDMATQMNWILFFDEADSLFGKRTQINNSSDRYANQEVSYLLQRMEDYPNVLIVASDLNEKFDSAFARRFQSIIQFPMPGPKERLLLWQQAFSRHTTLEEHVDLDTIAANFELSAESIRNVVQYASLQAVDKAVEDTPVIRQRDILAGIQREMRKEGNLII